MYRDIFPLKNNSTDPEKRIDCGEPTLLELLSGKQQIAFAIKGKATLNFEMCFRLYQNQLNQYLPQLQEEYPEVQFSVHENRLNVTLTIPYLCDTYPLTTEMTSASYVHNQTWIAVRNASCIADDIYSRVLSLHIERVALERGQHGAKTIATATMGSTGNPE
jgi:hypothetical protein